MVHIRHAFTIAIAFTTAFLMMPDVVGSSPKIGFGLDGPSATCRCCIDSGPVGVCRECSGTTCTCSFDAAGLPQCTETQAA